MRILPTIICLIINCLVYGQSNDLAVKLNQADTVFLISHEMTSRSSNRIVDSLGREMKVPDLIIRGKLNKAVVVEKKVLSAAERSVLTEILTYKYEPTILVVMSRCYDPHHSIIIIKKNKLSFIDLCFHCLAFEQSKDIKELEIRDDKWEKLYQFFKDRGFKYEMYPEE